MLDVAPFRGLPRDTHEHEPTAATTTIPSLSTPLLTPSRLQPTLRTSFGHKILVVFLLLQSRLRCSGRGDNPVWAGQDQLARDHLAVAFPHHLSARAERITWAFDRFASERAGLGHGHSCATLAYLALPSSF